MEENPQDLFQELREALEVSPVRIVHEFSRTANSWLACYGTRLNVIICLLDGDWLGAAVSDDRVWLIQGRLKHLLDRYAELKRQYPGRDDMPPDVIRDELLDRIKHLLD